ncbi:pyridoxamine 5'-phosphate oxidase family protein [Streptomyces sp. NPDC060194]|uniref:pyridoxamine 5'-phosphate oxidase family protein n=1 Tax=Streptomyces sp. NPDC060194 TaxID=3347069 RepID=UPI003647ACDB
MAASDYHPGERAVQRRSGLLDSAASVARIVRNDVPDVAARFLADRPMLVVGAADGAGRMWASLLTGPPGFAAATGPTTVTVRADPLPGDPLHQVLTDASGSVHVGMLAIDPGTRRRMRLNGTTRPAPQGFLVDLDQVYANCPKYIQRRELPSFAPLLAPSAPRRGQALDPGQLALVAAADTFFVATADRDGNADASHRGGRPGFLRALSPTRLRWPDYAGNAMFNTLGNIDVNPRTGLLLTDWTTGTTLQLSGTAAIDWDGGERAVDFTVEHAVETPHASPLRWSDPEYSRFNPPLEPGGAGGGGG